MTDQGLEMAAKIASGEYDKHLGTISAAIVNRLVEGHATDRWRIDAVFDGVEYMVSEDDLTMGEVAAVEFRTGKSWVQIDPRNHAGDGLAILTVRLITKGVDNAEQLAKNVPANEFVDWLSTYTVTPDPKDTPAN